MRPRSTVASSFRPTGVCVRISRLNSAIFRRAIASILLAMPDDGCTGASQAADRDQETAPMTTPGTRRDDLKLRGQGPMVKLAGHYAKVCVTCQQDVAGVV